MDSLEKIKIAIAEDDLNYAQSIEKQVQHHLVKSESNLTFEVKQYATAQECLDKIEKDTDILLVDYQLELSPTVPYSIKEFVKIINNFCDDCKVVVLCDRKNESLAVDFFKAGAYDCIERNADAMKKISAVMRQALKEKIIDYYII